MRYDRNTVNDLKTPKTLCLMTDSLLLLVIKYSRSVN